MRRASAAVKGTRFADWSDSTPKKKGRPTLAAPEQRRWCVCAYQHRCACLEQLRWVAFRVELFLFVLRVNMCGWWAFVARVCGSVEWSGSWRRRGGGGKDASGERRGALNGFGEERRRKGAIVEEALGHCNSPVNGPHMAPTLALPPPPPPNNSTLHLRRPFLLALCSPRNAFLCIQPPPACPTRLFPLFRVSF